MEGLDDRRFVQQSLGRRVMEPVERVLIDAPNRAAVFGWSDFLSGQEVPNVRPGRRVVVEGDDLV